MSSAGQIDGGDAGTAALHGLSVLVVEDGWQLADALRLLLEKVGMVVVGPVGTAREAQALAAVHRPDVAVVDVNLNGEMAYALMDWLYDRGTGVVVISGYGDLPPSLRKFAATLHKPFTATALFAALELAAGRAH